MNYTEDFKAAFLARKNALAAQSPPPTAQHPDADLVTAFTKEPTITLQAAFNRGYTLMDLVDFVQQATTRYYNVQGIADIYECSLSTAAKIKQSGVIDRAIHYESPRKFYTDKMTALYIYPKEQVHTRKRKEKNQ